ncbi:MAG: GHKL domain-containing protein [Deltaproteobacteria bacterium]|nr:GHKL domain-containing protein [Deltaproteobacteria bacterium]
MTPPTQDNITEGKRFRLVKYFAIASFIVLIIFSFPFSVFISKKAKDILIKSYENYALIIGQNLSHQVFQNYMIPTMMRFGQLRLRDTEQYELMDRVVKNTIHSFNIDRVNIYSIKQGVIAYSTNPELIGDRVTNSKGYEKAVSGEHFSGLVSEGTNLWGLEIGRLKGEKKMRTYIPFRGVVPSSGEEFIIGVFELTQDMTEQYESIVKFQYLVFGMSTLIMVLIFLALLLIVHKAEKIIEKRAEEQRELEEQLHLAERLASLGEMVAGISHEIKNPLGIIQSTADFLSKMPSADEPQKRLSSVIKEESIRLNSIVTEFLDFARPISLNIRECNLEEILHKNMAFLEAELQKKNITYRDNLEGRSLKIQADADLLYRALLNIFINAMQSFDKNGSIDVRVNKEKADYILEIEDSGKGISKENIKKIFNPFFTTKDQGTGLGLPIVKKIIEGHGGSIGIESKMDSGTKVTIRLPRKH